MKNLKSIFNDKNFTTDNVVASREGIKDEEKSSLGVIVKTFCWSLDNKVKNQDEYIRKQVQELKSLNESAYKGSDTHNFSLERKVEFINNLQKTHDEVEDLRNAFYNLHEELFGSQYVKPIKKSNIVDTVASLEAQQLLAKYEV